MWPYDKRKYNLNNNRNLKLTGNNYYPHGKQAGAPNKEYFNQLSMSVSVGLNSFPANSIAPDGRIVRQYGINQHDVTDEFYGSNRNGFRHMNFEKSGKQFHNRNVSQLKVVLNMPSKRRRDSLSQITTAIVKNEVVPPLSQLRNDEILSEHLKKSAANLQNAANKLPPLKRRSSFKAQRSEQLTNAQLSNERGFSVKLDEESDREDEDGLPYIGSRLPRRKDSDQLDGYPNSATSVDWKTGVMRRRKSFRLQFGLRKSANDRASANNYEQVDRKDSVGKITESIRDQFRAALQEQTMTQERKIDSRDSGITDAGLSVTGTVGNESIVKQIPKETSRNLKTGYQLRHEYGKNLEKNWFRNEYLKKQSRERRMSQSPGGTGYDLRLDIFYSPEPQSDELEDSDDDVANIYQEGDDDMSMQCGGFSTATAEDRDRNRRHRPSMQSVRKSLSLDTHKEEDECNGESSESDIEIILKDNQLIQRKTKHKMLKKRKRQIERYRPFLQPEMDAVSEQKETEECPQLTDQEIRALRLNLKNKEKNKHLKGKRKFLQVANAVFAFVQLRNILRLLRRRKRNIIRKRQQRIAKIVAKKWNKKAQDTSEDSDPEPTPKRTLKEQFLNDVGLKLIFDVERLNIKQKEKAAEEDDISSSEMDSENEDVISEKKPDRSKEVKQEVSKPSRFAIEVKKISMKDLANMKETRKVKRKRQRRRRHSIPRPDRPFEFLIEVPLKTRQRVSRSRASVQKHEIRRAYSPPAPKCSCHRGKHAEQRAPSVAKDPKCPHQPEVKKRKMKTIKVDTSGLMRTHSLENLAKKRPIELKDLLADIDIPAKEIKLQILARKFRRQRRKKQQIRLSPCRIPERQPIQPDESDADSDVSGGSDDSNESDYDFVYGGPFVGSGVMWNKNSKDAMKPTWTEEDVDREVKRITRIFHEMKECKYLRLSGFNDAIMEKLKQTSHNF